MRILEEEEVGRHKLHRHIVREEHWLRYGVSARRKRNQRRLETLRELRDWRQRGRQNRIGPDMKLSVQEAERPARR